MDNKDDEEEEVSSTFASLETRLPTFFLASSALVLSFLPSRPQATAAAARHAIFLVILLWLAVCLQHDDGKNEPLEEPISIYAHLVFFTIFLSFAWQFFRAAQAFGVYDDNSCHNHHFRRRRRRRCVPTTTTWLIHGVPTAISVGSWAALLVDTLVTTGTSRPRHAMLLLWTAVSVGVVAYMGLYRCGAGGCGGCDRRRRPTWPRGLVVGLPLVATSRDDFLPAAVGLAQHGGGGSSSMRSHDAEWYHWTVYESLQWMARLPNSAAGAGDSGEAATTTTTTTTTTPSATYNHHLVSVLGPEGLTCRQLLGLTATELHQATHLPLGMVLNLLEQVHALHEQSPCPPELLMPVMSNNQSLSFTSSRTTTVMGRDDMEQHQPNRNDGLVESSSWLDRYDAEYTSRPEQFHARRKGNDALANDLAVDDAMTDQAQTLMRDCFGMELPEIRNPLPQSATPQPSASAAASSAAPSRHISDPGRVVAKKATTVSSLTTSQQQLENVLPPDFLANMPPHIAAIAQQKPELVRKVLESKTKQQQQTQTKPKNGHLKMPPVPEETVPSHGSNQEGNEDEISQDDEYDATSGEEEGERTELLRRRRKKAPPHEYQSTWNGK